MPLPPGYASSGNAVVAAKGKQIIGARIMKHALVDPLAASTTSFHTGTPGPNTTTKQLYRTGLPIPLDVVFNGARATGILDYARNVVITVTHASAVVAVSGVITGVDQYGKVLTEAWSVTAGTTSKTFTGKKGFARVDSISVVAVADASADTVAAGHGNVFGLDANLDVASAVKEVVDGAVVTTGTFVAKSSAATDDQRGTYSPSTAPDGAHDYTVYYLSEQPELSS